MPRRERAAPQTLTLALAPALAVAVTLAAAHGLDALDGTAVVHADRVEVALEVEPGLETAALAQLQIHDESGRALPGRIAAIVPAATSGHVVVRSSYALSGPSRWLAFRMAPGEWSPSRARRLSLAVRDEGTAGPRVVMLTSGGNVETLRFGAPEPAPACGAAMLDRQDEGTSGVVALWRPEASGARADIVVPLGVLESWLPIARVDPDRLDASEQQAAGARVVELVASRVRLAAGHGEVIGAASGEVVFLGPDGEAAAAVPSPPRPLDAWTARVRVSLRFDRPGTLAWDLWNARVTTARVIVLDAGGCVERRISTYDPKL
jgi:hypothetical protein